MITGAIKGQIDTIWNVFRSGGIANPLEVMEQLTYLLFIKRLDDQQMLALNKANRLGRSAEGNPFPIGTDDDGRDYGDLRWSKIKNMHPDEAFEVVGQRVFPFIRTMRSDDSTYAHHMKDARLSIPSPGLLMKVIDLLDKVPMENLDTKGDVYEYMLSKIASAGDNGQFRTPRHIIQMMVEMMAPQPGDRIVDPASGTCGFLVAASEYMREHHADKIGSGTAREQYHHDMFHGFDFDNTMLRIGSMNMMLHGIENPDVRYRDSLAEANTADAGAYSMILANPPFAGSLDYENTAKDLQQIVKTKKTELLFMALFLRLLKPGGRAAVIVPDGVLFGSSTAHKTFRKMLVEDHKLDAVVKLPAGAFKPYAGVSTAILFFTRTDSGGTENVWFYEVTADGYSLDDKRAPLLEDEKISVLAGGLTDDEHGKNNLPDVLARWQQRDAAELTRPRTAQSFCVPKDDIAAQNYDLSLNRYKEIVHEKIEYQAPTEILDELDQLEKEITDDMAQLREMLSGGAL